MVPPVKLFFIGWSGYEVLLKTKSPNHLFDRKRRLNLQLTFNLDWGTKDLLIKYIYFRLGNQRITHKIINYSHPTKPHAIHYETNTLNAIPPFSRF